MILIDTSAWVEFLRDTGSAVCERVDAALADPFATCAPVRMEVLAGARDDDHLQRLRGLLARGTSLATPEVRYDDAAQLYRACRRAGETPQRIVDCLIAAVAVAAGVPILHADADFEVLARHTAVRTT